jgi:Protein of unknown function (DUF2934)
MAVSASRRDLIWKSTRKMDIIERIRDLAYLLWEGKGRPQGQHDEDWFEAEQLLREQGVGSEPENQGEGNYTGARAYDDAAAAFAHSGKVEPAAQDAVDSLNDPAQSMELARAEAVGKSRSHGEDPLLKKK